LTRAAVTSEPVESDSHTPLLASHGATFAGLVVEAWNGWRASAVLQLERSGSDLEEQVVGPLTFASKDAAEQWLQQVGKDHGFASIQIAVRSTSEAERKSDAAALKP
jgi:hypothetical protein